MTSPKVCFDARMALASGIGTYIRGLLPALGRRFSSPEALTLLTDAATTSSSPHPCLPLSARIYTLQEQLTVPWAFHRSQADLLHVPHYNIPLALASRCVVTVHDLIHLKFPEFLPSKIASLYAHLFFYQGIPRARAILTVSESTRKDLIEMLGIPEDKITVAPPGTPEGFRPQSAETVEVTLRSLRLSKGYYLYVGNLKEFKNVPRLLRAYKRLRGAHPETPPLVFVGKNFIPGFDQEMTCTTGVKWVPNLDPWRLPAIYSGALALVFPSLYEGFGLPPLEAMACGTPVICSNRASLPEVVGDAALFVDPLSTDEIMTAMRRIGQNASLAQELSAKGLQRSQRFSWANTAKKTFQVYQRALSGSSLTPSATK